MKILHIADFGPSSLNKGNGIGEVVSTLTRGLNKAGHESKIGLIRNNSNFSNDANVVMLDSVKEFEPFVKEYNPDIVIFHSLYKFK